MARRSDAPVRIPADVVADARIAASYKGMKLGEYLAGVIRPAVARDIEEGHARRARSSAIPDSACGPAAGESR